MKPTLLVLLIATSIFTDTLPAQSLPGTGAIKTGSQPTGAIRLSVEDIRRSLEDNGVSGELDMLRLTVSYQGEILPGVFPWIEAGWHDPELSSEKTNGGFTWGLGINVRPYLWPLRSDPALGPRDWLALTLELAARGGEADTDSNASNLEWTNLQGVVGLEWHKKFIGRGDGPIGSHDITSGAGLILNRTEASRGSFDGSEDSPIGFRLYTGFGFGTRNVTQLEIDLYGSSDHRISLSSGFRF